MNWAKGIFFGVAMYGCVAVAAQNVAHSVAKKAFLDVLFPSSSLKNTYAACTKTRGCMGLARAHSSNDARIKDDIVLHLAALEACINEMVHVKSTHKAHEIEYLLNIMDYMQVEAHQMTTASDDDFWRRVAVGVALIREKITETLLR
ncbi:MAG: hypothetical protein NTX86_04615 [Candidatus Dependentiae bacterium]|nr:hypothetical protein [Candidatus Dependentiae bacterium]